MTLQSANFRFRGFVYIFMKTAARRLGPAELLIVIRSCLFIFVLWLSAYFEADIRWLQFFQAWMYLATIWLSLRRSRWGLLASTPSK